jgi:tryptophan synthase alpha chain
MSRLQACCERAAASGRKLLVPYITAGDPHPGITVPLLHALVKAGADILELGVPFSDPMADGPVIQAACERALAHHVSLRGILEMVTEFRRQDTETPLVLMGYLNPIEAIGYGEFAAAAARAGVDGVLTVDLAAEEADEFVGQLRGKGLDAVFLVAPTSTDERIEAICRLASGYLYYVSLKGVTGSSKLDVDSVAGKLRQLRRHSQLPIAVGFGIRDPQSAAAVAQVADAVVVGSSLVSRIGNLCKDEARLLEEVPGVLAEMRSALDRPASPDRAKRA